ncbi:hypothetical protein [Arenibaculum pallidiluteum]|uniref:hypothetical protein n=1 Tax=Arenibaculum pallidiluteum TaxID=2812559 RepID=UPI001A96FC13|nr:hypothetical protein [Arenibaculum pallidiluteum]
MEDRTPIRRGSVPAAGAPRPAIPALAAALARAWQGTREPVLFYAERDPKVLYGAWLMVFVFMLPFGLAIPDSFFPGVGVSLMALWICRRTFRFELTRRHLRYRPNAIAPMTTLPLSEIEDVLATDLLGREAGRGPGPERGHLLIRSTAGALVVKSILRPQEAAEAIMLLRSGR